MLRNRVTREMKKTKRRYHKEFVDSNLSNMKKHGNVLRKLQTCEKMLTLTYISYLSRNGKQIDSYEEIANSFINFFTNVGPELDKNIPISRKPNGVNSYLSNRIPHSFLITPLTS